MRDQFILTYGNCSFGGMDDNKFLHEIWQIHQAHINEEICVQPKVRIAVQLSYWVITIYKIANCAPKVDYLELSRGPTQDYSILLPYLCHISSFNNNSTKEHSIFIFIHLSSSRTQEYCQCTDIKKLPIKWLLKTMKMCQFCCCRYLNVNLVKSWLFSLFIQSAFSFLSR